MSPRISASLPALLVALLPAVAAAQAGAPPPAPPAPPSAKLPRLILVEATGTASEIEAFVDRFRFEGEERETFALVDARLSGASFAALATEPDGERAQAFRKEWPGPVWLSANLAGCDPKVVVTSIPDQTPEGYRYNRTVVEASVECKVEIRRLESDRPGKPETLTFAGSVKMPESSGSGFVDEPMQEAARAAATKAAKKLAPKKR